MSRISCFLLDAVEQEYLKDWHPRLIGLTGTPEQVLTLLLAVVVFAICVSAKLFHSRALNFLLAQPVRCPPYLSVRQVAQVARTFRVFFSKAKTGDGPEDYLVDHRSGFSFLAVSVCAFLLTNVAPQHHYVSHESKWGALTFCM